MSVALLIIDMQNKYLERPGFKEMFTKASAYINATSELFRTKKHLVIHVQQIDSVTESRGEAFKVSEKINQDESDIYITKQYSSSFWETELDRILKEHDIDFLVLSGLSAGYCVLATYNAAIERGYQVSLLQHGLLANDQSELSFVLSTRAVISYSAVSYLLNHIK